MQKRIIISILTLAFLITGTTLVVFYGRGYRINLDENRLKLAGTGLLVATSTPDGASIFLNGRLTSATNTTLNLPPGDYDVKIVKDGYLPWEKRLKIQEEIVTKGQAQLLPQAPKLESLTSIGARNPIVDPTKTRIAFSVSKLSRPKNGIYMLDMAGRPILTLQNAASLIANDVLYTFSQSMISWSPSGKELIATISSQLNPRTFILSPDKTNQEVLDETQNLPTLKTQWDKEQEEQEKAALATLTPKLAQIVEQTFSKLAYSPDQTKILYVASQSAKLKRVIDSPLPGSNSQPEQRTLEAGHLYIYDIKEDKNFLISDKPESLSSISFMPDSFHLVFVEEGKIKIMEYDSTNKTTVYSGPFDGSFVTPWPDGSKLVILTNLGDSSREANLYTISLR